MSTTATPDYGGSTSKTDEQHSHIDGERDEKHAISSDKKNIATGENQGDFDCGNYNKNAIAVIVVLVVILIIVLCVVFIPRGDDDEEENVPTAMDFQTGISLVSSYNVSAVVTSRLATTTIIMEVVNALACSSIRSVSLRLPDRARISSLKSIATMRNDDEEEEEPTVCTTYGVVQELEEARENFLETAAEGLPSAYIEQQNEVLHSLQVAIPPLGTSTVELVLEELLEQRLGRVALDLPFAPNEQIDQISFNLNLLDDAASSDLHLDLGNDLELASGIHNGPNSTNMIPLSGTFSVDIPDAFDYDDLPRLLRGSFTPQQLPQGGLLQVDDNCFEMQFLPPDLEPLTRNIVFVVDAAHRDAQGTTKAALKRFVNTSLVEGDAFSIQLYGRQGTEDLYRAPSVNPQEIEDAITFIDQDWNAFRSSNTNIQEAFLHGLLRAQRDMEAGSTDVTLLVLISAGWANTGETDRQRILESIYLSNFESGNKPVKIYSVGYDKWADFELLNAISVMNGGVSTRVNYVFEMDEFFESEFGTVLLSDVTTVFETNTAGVYPFGETQVKYPLLADGYEVVIRGLLSEHEGDVEVTATTNATTNVGSSTWTAVASQDDAPKLSGICYQSYAHSRIDQLLRLRDVANLVSDETLKKIARLTQHCKIDDDNNMADCIEVEALRLAIDAGVVVEGLTSMVTIDEDECLSFEDENEICVAGTNGEGEFVGTQVDDQGYDEPAPAPTSALGGYDSTYPPASAPPNHHSFIWAYVFGMLLIVSLAFVV
mmetsp:Transcript_29439/g.71051  ORF Transcript_29439/g.71051 Transcript_29439/m.71051 type:complete len:771 (-) Transcript_29439:139-2451(-)